MTWQTVIALLSIVLGPLLVWWSARRTAAVESRKASDTRELGLIDRWQAIATAHETRLATLERKLARYSRHVDALTAHINAGLPPPPPPMPPESN